VMLPALSMVGMGIGELIRRRNEQRYQSATPPEA